MKNVKNQSLRSWRTRRDGSRPTTSHSTHCAAAMAATTASRWNANTPTATERRYRTRRRGSMRLSAVMGSV